jgi:hypothetical protein
MCLRSTLAGYATTQQGKELLSHSDNTTTTRYVLAFLKMEMSLSCEQLFKQTNPAKNTKTMKLIELLDAREAARKKVVIALRQGKEPEENDSVQSILEQLAAIAAGQGFDEGVRFVEESGK